MEITRSQYLFCSITLTKWPKRLLEHGSGKMNNSLNISAQSKLINSCILWSCGTANTYTHTYTYTQVTKLRAELHPFRNCVSDEIFTTTETTITISASWPHSLLRIQHFKTLFFGKVAGNVTEATQTQVITSFRRLVFINSGESRKHTSNYYI